MYVHARSSLELFRTFAALHTVHGICTGKAENSQEGTILNLSSYVSIYNGDAMGSLLT